MKLYTQLLVLLMATLFFTACNKDETTDEKDMPSTYNFNNVSFSGQTERLDMLAELTAEMKKTNNGETIDATVLANMFSNTGSPFTNSALNASTKDLQSKCFSTNSGSIYSTSTFDYLLNYLASASADAGNTWSPGNAGVATSGTKAYFFDDYGVEYTQIIEKGLMGAVFYYQAAEVYTRDGKIGDAVDNTTVTPGEGTDMEHHWDEAFGYLGIPTDLTVANFEEKLANGEVRYHGKYAEIGQDAGLNTVQNLINALIKGRFGISNNETSLKEDAAIELRKEWEMVLVTTAIHYLNSAQSNFADDALRNHALSEAYAFIISLYYNSDKLISTTDLETVKAYFQETPPGSPQPIPSFLNVTNQDLIDAKNTLSNTYGLNSVKDIL